MKKGCILGPANQVRGQKVGLYLTRVYVKEDTVCGAEERA